jgi:hypothetical protein
VKNRMGSDATKPIRRIARPVPDGA